tara:strand:+ start:269 stop:541 length:273 start_codon:yes stop_codon:yes gene_type:complete
MKSNSPNPWIALLINSFVPGLGYMYCGTKWLWFNITLIFIEILRYLELIIFGTVHDDRAMYQLVIGLIVGTIFGIDAFRDAYFIRKEQRD